MVPSRSVKLSLVLTPLVVPILLASPWSPLDYLHYFFFFSLHFNSPSLLVCKQFLSVLVPAFANSVEEIRFFVAHVAI